MSQIEVYVDSYSIDFMRWVGMFVAFFSRGFSNAFSLVCDTAQNDVIKGLVTSSAQVSSLSTLTRMDHDLEFPTCNEIKWNAIWLWIDRLNLLPENSPDKNLSIVITCQIISSRWNCAFIATISSALLPTTTFDVYIRKKCYWK